MYIGATDSGDRRLVHAVVTVDGHPFRANLRRDIDQFWRLRMEPFVPGPEADGARNRFRAILDQDGWNSLLESKRIVEATIRRTGASWSGWEAEGNGPEGGRQVGSLGQEKSAPRPLVTWIEASGLAVGAAIALSAGIMMKPGAVRAFLVGAGGSVTGAAIYSILSRKV